VDTSRKIAIPTNKKQRQKWPSVGGNQDPKLTTDSEGTRRGGEDGMDL
jgi:hypothetical protein